MLLHSLFLLSLFPQVLSILDGQLFPMKALGYFAVVAGRGGDSVVSCLHVIDHFVLRNKSTTL